MELEINNILSNKVYAEELTIGDVVTDITKDLQKENRVICQLLLNDTLITEALENEALKQLVGSTKNLKIFTEQVNILVLNGIKSLNSLIPELIRVIGNTSNLFRIGETNKAQNLFVSVLEALELVPTILDGIRGATKLDFSTLSVSSQKLDALEKTMFKTIQAIYEAQNKNDYVHMADLLEYELNPNLESWFEALPLLENKFQETSSVGA